MHWNPTTGALSRARADQLGMTDILSGYLDA
jgi:hypothetical protein